jgi:peptidoglycan/LPS O-acetylase OafA/YrhL
MKINSLGFKYLSHVDSLRALSVIAVILFHLNPELFFFGYLGVDVFFVISGYVITNSLYQQQIIKKQNLSLFYVKRIKRIFPILILVIFTFLIFYIFFSPLKGETNFILKSAITSLFGLSNLFFINNEVNYFFIEEINPLLHTWSLGIEEQFYLIYPILLITIFKILKDRIEIICHIIILFISGSLIIYYFNDGLIGNFYSPIARFWELGIGCLAFFYNSLSVKKRKLLLISIFFLFFFSIINLQNDKIIQNSNILATIFSFIFIVKLRNLSEKFILLLNNSGLPYIGKLSYSLYLWHLPVLYFCEIYFTGVIEFFFITISLSIISYHFYENPIRKSNFIETIKFNVTKKTYLLITFSFGLLIFGYYNFKKIDIYQFLKQFNYPEQKLGKYLTRLDYRHHNYLNADCYAKENLNICYKKNDIIEDAIFLTGDSHADHFLVGVDNISFVNPYFYNNFAQCEIILKSFYNPNAINISDDCNAKYDENYHRFINDKFDNYSKNTIIISLRLSEYLSADWRTFENTTFNKKEIIQKNYEEFISLFPKKNIILITTVPESKVYTEKCIFNEYFRKELDIKIFTQCHFKKNNDINRYNQVKNLLENISKKNSSIKIYDPYPLLCSAETCDNYSEEKDFFLLHDDNHLSIEASKFISEHLSIFLNNN